MKYKIFALALLLGSVTGHAVAAPSPADPTVWFADEYAPLWANMPGNNIDRLLTFYADVIVTHESSGEVTRTDKTTWLKVPMAGWLTEGWLNATLLDLKSERISATTASFKASWLDRYTSDPEEVSCGWYVADWQSDRWVFTTYADIDCAAHQLKQAE